jgi:hypothetical protein
MQVHLRKRFEMREENSMWVLVIRGNITVSLVAHHSPLTPTQEAVEGALVQSA